MNLDIWRTLFLALLQGVTELFPISSLGHTVILPPLLGWGDLVDNPRFLPLIVALHLGTSVALVLYFWRDWLQVIVHLQRSLTKRKIQRGTDEWVSWLILIGCIPAGLLGVLFKDTLESLFSSPQIAAAFLVVNGSILFIAERFRRSLESTSWSSFSKAREAHFRPLASLSWKEALIVGCFQSLALIPGISRSGSTMVGGLLVRLRYEDAARYSFLLGTPLIAGAALLEVPKLFGLAQGELLLVSLGIVLSGVAAFLSTKFLMKYFETGRLLPFAFYCWGIGLVALALFFTVFHLPA